jgi:glucosamine-6-phosphate deaminase
VSAATAVPCNIGVRLRVLRDPAEVAWHAADALAEAAFARPGVVLALPTGRTPIPMYDELARRHREGRLDLSQARGFNLDELVLPAGDPRTFRAFMEQHAWDRIGLPRTRCDIPNGAAPDLAAECARYEAAIEEAGGLDLALLGVGVDGHVAYNMPGPVEWPTHVVRLPDGLAASLEVPADEWPLRAITMGLGTIRSARRIVVLATGGTKATAVRALLEGRQDPDWPCSFLCGHPDIEVLADADAAAQVRR